MTDDRVTLAIVTDLGGSQDSDWRFRAVDRDDFDTLPGRIGAAVDLGGDGDPRLAFETMGDFSPEGIAARLPDLAGLLAARQAAGHESEVRRLAVKAGVGREVESILDRAEKPAPPAPPPAARPEPSAEEAGQLLDSILDSGSRPDPTASSLDQLFREAAAAAVPADSTAEKRHRWAVDQVLGWRLRAILRHAGFRRLESAWRSLRALVASAETGPDLRLVVLAAPEEALRADLVAAFESDEPGVLQLSLEAARDRWGVVDGLFVDLDLGPDAADLRAIVGLSRVARSVGCPAVADGRPGLAGVADAADLRDHRVLAAASSHPDLASFRTFRQTPLASSVGLCLPRVLLRMPYGPDTAVVDGFDFDETAGDEEFTGYLWGSSAMALARVAAVAFVAEGRGARLEPYAKLTGLPVHVFTAASEDIVRGPTEVALPDAAALALRDAGFMPLQAVRGTDGAQFSAVQPLATARGPLFGGESGSR